MTQKLVGICPDTAQGFPAHAKVRSKVGKRDTLKVLGPGY